MPWLVVWMVICHGIDIPRRVVALLTRGWITVHDREDLAGGCNDDLECGTLRRVQVTANEIDNDGTQNDYQGVN